MVNYDSETGADVGEALQAACRSLKGYEFDQSDLDFYFNQVELQMRTNGVKKNYTKFLVLSSILPVKVRDQVKPLLRKQESDFTTAGQMPYKVLKDKILAIFRPPQESDFERAMSRVLSGRPSDLARELVNDLCDHELVGCCCAKFIVGLWKKQLPLSVRQSIASMTFNAANFEEIVKLADDVFSQGRHSQVSALSGAVSLPAPAVFDEGFRDELPVDQVPQVAGLGRGGRGQGRGQRGGRGRGGRGGFRGGQQNSASSGVAQSQGQSQNQSNSGQNKNAHPRHKTQRHPDSPPFKACYRHWTFGKSAHFCMEPGTCPWKDFWVPKPNQ